MVNQIFLVFIIFIFDRQVIMKTNFTTTNPSDPRSFAEVLSSVQRDLSRSNTATTPPQKADFNAESSMSFLGNPLEFPKFPRKTPWTALSKNSLYKKVQKVTPEKIKPPHLLTPEQNLEMEFFKSLGIALSPAFSQSELKKAYRRLCFKTHPDRNGSSEDFIKLKKAYEGLELLFKK